MKVLSVWLFELLFNLLIVMFFWIIIGELFKQMGSNIILILFFVLEGYFSL